MNHQSYMRLVRDADCAVLFIHGILGSPDHFDFLIPLVPEHVSVQNLLLPGHGSGVREFSASSMSLWENTVAQAIADLSKNHTSIYIVAHSMGTLFAIQEAITTPSVKGLFLLAVPICPFPRSEMFSNARKVYSGQISDNDTHGKAADAAYSLTEEKNLLRYLPWSLRYFELFRKIGEVRMILPQLTTPSYAYQSVNDEMVSKKSIPYLKNHSSMVVHELKNSWHNLYSHHDRQLILDDFKRFIDEMK